MLIYSIIMFMITILFLYLAINVNNGKTYLIKSYHQEKVREEDKPDYGKAFSKGLFGISLSTFISGVIPFFLDTKESILPSLMIVFGGIMISFIIIIRVQIKYNGGIF